MDTEKLENIIKLSPMGFAHHQIILDGMNQPVDYRFEEVNQAFEKLTGLTAKNIVGKTVREVLPGIEKAGFDWIGFYGKIALAEGDETFELYSETLNRWYKVQVYSPQKHFFTTLFLDITTEKEQGARLKETEKRFRGLVESQSDLIVRIDNENRFTYVNNTYCRIFGKSADELLGKSFFPLIHEDDRESTETAMELLKTPPHRCSMEQRAMTVDGWRWLAWEDSAILDEKGNIVEVQGVGRDITELKEKEEKLRKHAASMQTLLKGVPAVVYSLKLKEGVPFTFYPGENDAGFLGYKPEFFFNNYKLWHSFIHPDDQANVTEINRELARAATPGSETLVEYRFKDSGGNYRWVSDRKKVVAIERGETEIVGVLIDITEEKRKNRKLRRYRQRLTLAQTFAKTGSWEYDLASGSLDWSMECEALFGLEEGTFEGTFEDFLKRVHPDDRDYVVEVNSPNTQLQEGIPLQYEHRIIRPYGEIAWVKETAGVVNDASGKPEKIIGLVADVTQDKIAAQAIENEEKLRQIVDHIDGVFWLRSADRRKVLYVSPSLEPMFGITRQELYDNPDAFTDAVHPDDKVKVEKALEEFRETGAFSEEYRIVRPDGNIRWVVSSAFPVRNETGEIIRFAGIVTDFTQQKENEIAAKEQTGKMNAMIEAMPDMIFIMHRDGTIIEIFGADPDKLVSTPEELTGISIIESFSPEEAQRHLKVYNDCLDNQQSKIIEFELTINNRKLEFESRIQPLDDERLLTIVRDISQRKAIERERDHALDLARKDRQRFEEISEYTREFIWEVDAKGVYTYVNSAVERMLGYTPEEIQGSMSCFDLMPEEERLPFREEIIKIFEKKQPLHEIPNTLTTKDGRLVYCLTNGIPVLDADGELLGYRGSDKDITLSKKAEEALRQSELKYRMLFNANIDSISIFYLNEDGLPSEFVEMNEAGANIIGYDNASLLSMKIQDIEEPSSSEKILQRIRTLKEKGEASFESNVRKKNGELIDIDVKAVLINYNDRPAILNITRDITEQKQLLRDLTIAKEKAEESNRLKTAFMNNISHEVRTPLNGILGFGDFMMDEGLSQSEKEQYYCILKRSSDRLQQTITDIMDISEITAGTVRAARHEVHVASVLSDLQNWIKEACNSKNIQISLQIPEKSKHLVLLTDDELLNKILKHLLTNAGKFTSKGRITYGFDVKDEMVEFFVRDTGQGIAEDKLDSIFDPFFQEDASSTRGHEGSGLGLAITRGMVTLLGGKQWVESIKNKGSVFYFTLPMTDVSYTGEGRTVREPGSKANAQSLVLIAEDDETNYLLLQTLLKKEGCSSLHALNGAEAVELCRQYPEISLVLMDIKMPVMNGLEATALIKEFRPDLPVIAITAHAETGDRDRILQAGCDEYLPKPVSLKLLKSILSSFAGG